MRKVLRDCWFGRAPWTFRGSGLGADVSMQTKQVPKLTGSGAISACMVQLMAGIYSTDARRSGQIFPMGMRFVLGKSQLTASNNSQSTEQDSFFWMEKWCDRTLLHKSRLELAPRILVGPLALVAGAPRELATPKSHPERSAPLMGQNVL